jgi:hypothetical protein
MRFCLFVSLRINMCNWLRRCLRINLRDSLCEWMRLDLC